MVGFVVALVLLLAIVPAATLAATGSWRATWEALKGYALVLAIIWGAGAVIAILGLLAYVINS